MEKIYLASRYSMRHTLRHHAAWLESLGHEITSTWLHTDWPGTETGSANAPPEYREKWAEVDLKDVQRSTMMISFSSAGDTKPGRGGCHAEFGAGLLLVEQEIYNCMVLIGPHEHLFHHHPRVIHHETWNQFATWFLKAFHDLKALSAKLSEAQEANDRT